jgi:hypothetical protein
MEMNRIEIAPEGASKQIDAFRAAVLSAKRRDTIVYHVGFHCQGAPLRCWAMGAYEAGLVLLVKKRKSGGVFDHYAIRTSKRFRNFTPTHEK